jgi:hypothetical protein
MEGSLPLRGTALRFLFTSAQLALLLLILWQWDIEPSGGFPRILPMVFGGFIVHAALPLAWRASFFVLLSMTVIAMIVGPLPAAILIGIGLGLIGLCHLPVSFPVRIALVAAAGAALALWMIGWLNAVPPQTASNAPSLARMIVPVLGSMFMFRIIIYLYDLKHEGRAAAGAANTRMGQSAALRLSYFFLLPNVCFLLFPIVDYRTFRRTYYDKDAQTIYQRGVWLIFLGITCLLGYRLVYHYLVPSPEEVDGVAGISRFMMSSYLIYLRVVGQFHLIIGVLCLFGFNLPPVHRYFLLASSFTDFWRRARIEWKDFMVKIFYYPVIVPLQRSVGPTLALIVGTVGVFAATWLLHTYQWFWLHGDLRLSTTDGVFWIIIGSCVLVNSLLEARGGRTSPSRNASWTMRAAVVHVSKVLGMFLFMCILWSYWSSPSVRIWFSYMTALEDSGWREYAVLASSLIAAMAVGVIAHYLLKKPKVAGAKPTKAPVSSRAEPWRPALIVATALAMLLVKSPWLSAPALGPANDVVVNLSSNSLNASDQDREDRGYYQVLLDEPRSTAGWLMSPSTGAYTPEDIPDAIDSSRVEGSAERKPPEAGDTTDGRRDGKAKDR